MVVVTAGLGRLTGRPFAMLGAATPAGCHILAAVHAAVIVAVGAAAVLHAMAFMLAGLMLLALLGVLARLMLARLARLARLVRLVLLMVLMLGGSRLRESRSGEHERHRGKYKFHVNSPEAFN